MCSTLRRTRSSSQGCGLIPWPKALASSDSQRHDPGLGPDQDVQAGDTVFMPAWTIHALGPGLLIYEVQQTSDLTYRVFDWNRPATPGRMRHIEKSLAVADPSASAPARHVLVLAAGSGQNWPPARTSPWS